MTENKEEMDAALAEAVALFGQYYPAEDDPGLLHWLGRPDKRVPVVVWFALRAMILGLGAAEARKPNR